MLSFPLLQLHLQGFTTLRVFTIDIVPANSAWGWGRGFWRGYFSPAPAHVNRMNGIFIEKSLHRRTSVRQLVAVIKYY